MRPGSFLFFCAFSWRVVPLSAELDSLRIKSRIIEHRYCRGNDDEVNHLCWSEIAGDSGKSPIIVRPCVKTGDIFSANVHLKI